MAQISETKAEQVKCVALRVIDRKAAGGQQHVIKQLGSGTTAAQNEYGSRASGRLRTVVHQAVCLGRFQFRRHVLFFPSSSVRWAREPEFTALNPLGQWDRPVLTPPDWNTVSEKSSSSTTTSY